MRENRVPLVFILLIVVVFVLAAFDARASGDRITQSNDMNNQTSGDIKQKIGVSTDVTTNVTGGTTNVAGSTVTGSTQTTNTGPVDVNVGGSSNKSYALGMAGLGDVDLNEGRNCMGTEAFSIAVVAKQDMKLNPWCAALFYDANGKHEMAARARCLLPEILYMSGRDEAQCIADNTMEPQLKTEIIEDILPDHDDEDYEALKGEIASLKAEVEQSKEKARKATLEARYAVQEAKKPSEVHPEVQQEISAYERRLRNARAAYAGEK